MLKKKAQIRAAVNSKDYDEAYRRLKDAIGSNKVLRDDLDIISSTAAEKHHYFWWIRRFVFGFGVSKAVEEWFQAFEKTDPTLSILVRIPHRETANVIAKWTWFVFFFCITQCNAKFIFSRDNCVFSLAAKRDT